MLTHPPFSVWTWKSQLIQSDYVGVIMDLNMAGVTLNCSNLEEGIYLWWGGMLSNLLYFRQLSHVLIMFLLDFHWMMKFPTFLSQGDSGGGVVYKKMIYGVIAFTANGTHGCVAAAGYVDICKYQQWIENTAGVTFQP